MFDYSKWEKRGFAALIKSRAKSYIVPYCTLFAINLVIYSALMILSGRTYTLQTFLSYIVAGIYSHDTKMPNCAPLWFLTCIFVSYILFWFIVSRKNSLRKYVIAVSYIITLLIICALERKLGIDQLPWHLDTAFAGSVFMLLGNEFKRVHRLLKEFGASVSNARIIISSIIIASVMISSFFILVNDRAVMVLNRYGNIVLFLISAVLMCASIMYVFSEINVNSKMMNVIREILAYWGRNTIVFLGFNYVFNLVLSNIFFRLINVKTTMLYCIVDIIVVMLGCTIISFIWNNMRRYIYQK